MRPRATRRRDRPSPGDFLAQLRLSYDGSRGEFIVEADFPGQDPRRTGRVIEDYPTAKPLPARLILGWIGSRPLHAVAGFDAASQTEEVVTVYEPEPAKWDQNFSVRRKKP
ncbi:MAG: DUF4258 domain-containing protein [Deltaproteobacteria bacterium]|nr:DUF4258 domain-containing protein [Deltaproteobacteria bacterium]